MKAQLVQVKMKNIGEFYSPRASRLWVPIRPRNIKDWAPKGLCASSKDERGCRYLGTKII